MADVATLGELLIDFVATHSGRSLAETPAFQKAAGGAPANVAVGLARLGIPVAFLGKVGNDPFGHFLAQTLAENDVDVAGLRFSDEARTALAFVSLAPDGERDFLFYRHPSADILYRPDEVAGEVIQAARLFHFGSISLIQEPVRAATLHAVELAREAGCLISYDPNLRLALWPDAARARAGIALGWQHAQLIKVSEEELFFLSGAPTLEAGVRQLWHAGLRLLVVTRGEGGVRFFTPTQQREVPGFSVPTVDTTGAGDGFVAGLLRGVIEAPDALADPDALVALCRYANAVGALTTTQRGAIPALPTSAQVAAFLASR